jgi:hypothetical protein
VPTSPFFQSPLDACFVVQISLLCLLSVLHVRVWILHLWAPLPPSLSPSPLCHWNSPLSHPLGVRPPHASAASCSSPLLPLTIVRASRLCSEQYVLAFGVSLHKNELCSVLFLSICFIVQTQMRFIGSAFFFCFCPSPLRWSSNHGSGFLLRLLPSDVMDS